MRGKKFSISILKFVAIYFSCFLFFFCFVRRRNFICFFLRREGWPVFSLYGHWQQLVDETKIEARNRAATADLYVNHVTVKLANEAEELQRISKRVDT